MITFIGLGMALVQQGSVEGSVTLSNAPLGGAVVTVEGTGVKPKPLANAVIDQRGKAFIPHVTAITPGTTVQFPNNDTVYHNVFAHYDAARFDLGVYPKNARKTKVFPKPGVVSLLCSIHSEMNAYIVIVDTPFYAVTKPDGTFKIDGLPRGNFTLKVWHESGASASEDMAVGQDTKRVLIRARR